MARKPARKPAGRSPRPASAGATAAPATPTTDREKIVAAFLTLLADERFESIGLADVAAQAGVSLAQLRDEFPSMLAILAAHIKATDRAVLAADISDMAEEPERERLFDVLMRRIEALAPHKEALRSLLRSAMRDPGLALALNAMAVRSQQWMLAAADISSSGPRGLVRAQGLALLFARALRTFVDDDDEGHARTMAVLDRELARGARWVGLLDDLCRFVPRCRPRRRRARERDEGDEVVAA